MVKDGEERKRFFKSFENIWRTNGERWRREKADAHFQSDLGNALTILFILGSGQVEKRRVLVI